MNRKYEEFCEKFHIQELTILETKHWVWSVRPMQPTIGCGILSMKRPAGAVSEMTEEEGADMVRMIRVIERTLTKTFHYQRVHYILYMLEDFHVHYHVLPRYDSERIFQERAYTDTAWPGLPSLVSDPVPEETLYALRDFLRENAER